MKKLCSDFQLAASYDFSARHYLPQNTTYTGPYPYSSDLGPSSIMMYGSYAFAKHKDPKDWEVTHNPVLLFHAKDNDAASGLQLIAPFAYPSAGDLERVAQLYPPTSG